MQQNPLISVIIPVYNVNMYLDECIESVIGQSYTNIQVILIDDGSTDGSGTRCDFWKEQDERIITLHKKNGGISSARNHGMQYATGKYICFIDSDDKIEKDYLKKLYYQINITDADFCGCGFFQNDIDGSFSYYNNELKEAISLTWKEYMEMVYSNCYYVTMWAKLFRRELFDDIMFPDGKNHEDAYIILDIAKKCKIITYIGEALYFYRQHGNSVMSEADSKLFEDDFDWIKKHINTLEQLNENKLLYEAKKLYCHNLVKNIKYIKKEKRKIYYSYYRLLHKEIIKSPYISYKAKLKYYTFGSPLLIKCRYFMY